MRKKEGRVNRQIIGNNNERANEYAEKERYVIRKTKLIFFYQFKNKTDSRFFNRKESDGDAEKKPDIYAQVL